MKRHVRHFPEIGGWVGMFLIHCATIPTSFNAIFGYSSHFPPLDMVLMIWSGLFLFFIRALYRIDYLYLFSNGLGFTLQSIMLFLMFKAGT